MECLKENIGIKDFAMVVKDSMTFISMQLRHTTTASPAKKNM